MKVAIIDNDDSVRQVLATLLRKFCPDVTEICEANGVHSGHKLVLEQNPQLIYMDVEMDDGTGFDLAEKIKEQDTQLVFITAYNKYAIKAFKFSAIDFLLKPIDQSELIDSVNKALKGISNKNLQRRLELLQDSLKDINIKVSDKKIALNDSNITHFIRIGEIIYCKSDGSYTTFYLTGGRKIMVTKILKEFEELFQDFGFIRTHNSYLINAMHILRFEKNDGGQLIMEENHPVPVSVRKKDEVLNALGRL